MLPEFEGYNKENELTMGYQTQKEVGYLSEILTYHALGEKKNVLVDGSLRDKHWYYTYFCDLRNKFPILKIAIINVTASKDAIMKRCDKRAEITGRYEIMIKKIFFILHNTCFVMQKGKYHE